MKQYFRGVVILVTSLVILCKGLAQQDSSNVIPTAIGQDISLAWRDAGHIATSPLHFSQTEWLVAGAIAAGTVVLFSVDESARSVAQRNQTKLGDDLSKIGKGYGGVYGVVFSGGLYASGLFVNDKELRKTGLMLIESMSFSFVATTVMKGI